MKTKTLKHILKFQAKPQDIYDILMNSKKHSELTDSEADISREVGGKISAYDGWIQGFNVNLVPGKKIIQKWRAVDWPKDHYSTAKFELKKMGDQTQLVFVQENVPEEHVESIGQGWFDYYWEPLKIMLEK